MTGPSASDRRVGPGILLLLATAIISGISTFVNLYAVRGTNSDAFVTVRNLVVAGMLVPLVVLGAGRTKVPLRRFDWARLVLIGLIGGAIPFLLFFRGLALASAAGAGPTASFFYRTLFLMAGLLGVIALGERFHPRVAVAAALLLAGNALLLSLTTAAWSDGSAYVLAATAFWAVEYTVSKWTLRDLPSGRVALGRMGFGGVFLAGYLVVTGQVGAAMALTDSQWIWVGVSALLLTAFVGTWYAGLRRVELGVATAVLVLGFPISWLLSVAVRGGTASVPQAVGAALVVGGAVIAIGYALLQQTHRFLARRLGPAAGAVD
jgi:drug/metabolite transporter (DMT)-like permease